MMLSSRYQDVLKDIVDIYTETGQPVGSKALAERSALALSSASYRNVMAELEKNGYLASPHTSAGRIPTEVGFRYYAETIVTMDDLEEEVKEMIRAQITPNKDFKKIVNDISQLLGELTSCTGLVSAPKFDQTELDYMEFLRIGGSKVLAVLVTKKGEVENRIIEVPEHISIEELNKSAKHLRSVVSGQTLADARVLMMQSLMEHKNRVDNLMDNMMADAEIWGEASDTDTALVVAGSQNLFKYPELVREQLQTLFKVFEEKRILMALMNEVQKGDGVQIFIGSDCPIEDVKECAMLTSSYGTKDKKILGSIGVVGPMRMNYKRNIQLMNYTSRLLSRVLEGDKEDVKEEK